MTGRYPSEEELKTIQTFDLTKEPIWKLLDLVESLWEYDNYFKRKLHQVELHTGGWSGNEDIIAALRKNFIFWSMYWARTERGGHYFFDDKMCASEIKSFLQVTKKERRL